MSLRFRPHWIADESYESCAVFDVNNDGIPDIVSGAFWYEGPEYRTKHHIGPVLPSGEYYDDFATIPLDVNGDGYLDFITGGWFGCTLQWRENPGANSGQWPLHDIASTTNIEAVCAWDIDGDGTIEIVPNCPGSPTLDIFKLITDAHGAGTGEFRRITVLNTGDDWRQGHGLGCGDIAGYGRNDLVLCNGWVECPSNPWEDEWTWHPEFQLGSASVPIVVADVNGDGLADLIVGHAHGYGLWWYEQRRTGKGREWIRHPIDPFNAQYHCLQWIDIDGDGQPELVTGKRHRAHCGNDPGEWDDYGIYYFKWNGESFSKQVITYGPLGHTKGVGIAFAVADLNGNGLLDIVAPGKDGLVVFFNEGPAPNGQ